MVIIYEDSNKAVTALYTLRESKYEDKHLLGTFTQRSFTTILRLFHFEKCYKMPFSYFSGNSYAVTKYRAKHGASRRATFARLREREIWRLSRASIDLQLSKTFKSVSGVRSRQWRPASWVCKKL